MSKAAYIGVGSVAHKIKKMYIGVDGVARKVKKGYIGVNGVARLFYTDDLFKYTGEWSVSTVEIDGAAFNLYTLTSSGTLTLGDDAQFWMCDGGENGGYHSSLDSDADARHAGSGGDGGMFRTDSIGDGEYVVTIGAAAGLTTIVSSVKTIRNNTNGSGGGLGGGFYGDGSVWKNTGGAGGGVSTIPFGLSDLKQHCAGGGGGCAKYIAADGTATYNRGRNGASNGGSSSSQYTTTSSSESTASGGTYGGGKGASLTTAATAGTFYGAGGGGASTGYNKSTSSNIPSKSRGDGYQGVCYILLPAA